MLAEQISAWQIEIFFFLSSGIFQFFKWIYFASVIMKKVIR